MSKLPYSFYQHTDVNQLAIQLLGKQLCTFIDGVLTAGTIVETEAYNGVESIRKEECRMFIFVMAFIIALSILYQRK